MDDSARCGSKEVRLCHCRAGHGGLNPASCAWCCRGTEPSGALKTSSAAKGRHAGHFHRLITQPEGPVAWVSCRRFALGGAPIVVFGWFSQKQLAGPDLRRREMTPEAPFGASPTGGAASGPAKPVPRLPRYAPCSNRCWRIGNQPVRSTEGGLPSTAASKILWLEHTAPSKASTSPSNQGSSSFFVGPSGCGRVPRCCG